MSIAYIALLNICNADLQLLVPDRFTDITSPKVVLHIFLKVLLRFFPRCVEYVISGTMMREKSRTVKKTTFSQQDSEGKCTVLNYMKFSSRHLMSFTSTYF